MTTQAWLGIISCGMTLLLVAGVIIYALSRVGTVNITWGIVFLAFTAGILTLVIALWFVFQSGVLPT